MSETTCKRPRLAQLTCKKLAAALVCSIAFLANQLAHAEQSSSNTTQSNQATQNASQEETGIGPRQPIGHTLKTPEAKKRIETLIAGGSQQKPQKDVVSHDLPTLVNGKYGFAAPMGLDGIPKAFVNLGSSFPTYAFVVEKLHHRLTVFRVTEEKKYEVVKTFRAITGKDPNDKLERGDFRTPEGIYFITGSIDGKVLPPKYGKMAFTLDYPNIYDQRRRKSGYGIWIHATDDPKRLLKPYDTEGCVAVSNEDIVELAKYIVPFETPIVITKEMTTGTFDEVSAPRKPAMEMVEQWRKSWENSSFDSYMSFYSQNFRSLGKSKRQWEDYKKSLSEMREKEIRVVISEPKILGFEDQLLVTFMQDYSSKQHSDFGRKFLYLQWEGDRYRIIAEKWYRVKKTETAIGSFRPFEKEM